MAQRPRSLSVYDGRDRLGQIELAANGTARAFDRWGKKLGVFSKLADAHRIFNTATESQVAGLHPQSRAKPS